MTSFARGKGTVITEGGGILTGTGASLYHRRFRNRSQRPSKCEEYKPGLPSQTLSVPLHHPHYYETRQMSETLILSDPVTIFLTLVKKSPTQFAIPPEFFPRTNFRPLIQKSAAPLNPESSRDLPHVHCQQMKPEDNIIAWWKVCEPRELTPVFVHTAPSWRLAGGISVHSEGKRAPEKLASLVATREEKGGDTYVICFFPSTDGQPAPTSSSIILTTQSFRLSNCLPPPSSSSPSLSSKYLPVPPHSQSLTACPMKGVSFWITNL